MRVDLVAPLAGAWIAETKKKNKELRRVLRNIAIVNKALGLLTQKELGFTRTILDDSPTRTGEGARAEKVAAVWGAFERTAYRLPLA